MSGRKELESGMDTTLGSDPKKVREAIERWSDNDRRILIQIIIKDNQLDTTRFSVETSPLLL